MSIVPRFEALASKSTQRTNKRKRPSPFSIRLSEADRSQLLAEAKGAPLGAYVKAKALGDPPLRIRRTGYSIEDRKALAQALALLGNGELTNSLSELGRAASIGALPLSPETEAALFEALNAVRDLRRLLVRALGLKEGDQ